MMDEEWEELERNGAEEVLASTCFIETQKLNKETLWEPFEETPLEAKAQVWPGIQCKV